MQSENRIFDDLAKVINGMAGTVAGMGREAESNFKDRAREWAGGLNMVSREEFDAVKQMAAKAREEADALALRVAKLEAAMKPAAKAAGKAAPIKTASAPSATKTAAKRKTSK
jgi:BMFP domain-containing protein YqiC